ncbi:hypothetical protein NE237_013176 [Protea cynaroides]|uniref:TF-B3 domain-containing protein n=1 Tax=Protea cynaroides TaxID=273540 RepID=A0A9Q0H180_9MAGN|nr:hypothetical protein NE237_013176 [Protea cynaroides]
MDPSEIPSKNSAFSPYKPQSSTEATMAMKNFSEAEGEDKRALESCTTTHNLESLNLNGSSEGITMVDEAMELSGGEDRRVLKRKAQNLESLNPKGLSEEISGSSTARFQNNFKVPAWESANKKVRTKLPVRNVFASESKKRDSLGSLKIQGGEGGEETMVQTRKLENEKNKKQMTENAISDSNYTSNEASLRTVSPFSEAISASKNEPQNQMSSLENKFLFEKKLSQSDVDDLNRLLLPTKSAEMYFPCLETGLGKFKKETLVFVDHRNISWEMTYEVLKSTRSYVLTNGWIEFVNYNQLRPNFVVRFYQLDYQNMDKKHFGIRYAHPELVKTIRLFGQDHHYLCFDETKGGCEGGNGGGDGGGDGGIGGSNSGQNKTVEGLAETAAVEEG